MLKKSYCAEHLPYQRQSGESEVGRRSRSATKKDLGCGVFGVVLLVFEGGQSR